MSGETYFLPSIPVSIHLLAPELIHRIAELLQDGTDLKNLRSICKNVKCAVDPLLFSAISVTAIATVKDILKNKISLLECLAGADTSASAIAQHVRTLNIGTLAPEFQSDFYRLRNGVYVRESPDVDEETKRECALKFDKYFRPALKSLVNIQRVSWTANSKDLVWTHHEIMGCLNRMQYLSELFMDFGHCTLTPSIQRLTGSNLTKFTMICDLSNGYYADAIASILARNSPSLRDLHLQHHAMSNPNQRTLSAEGPRTLDSLFERASFQNALHLHALQLSDMIVTGNSLPEDIDFRTLKRLEVKCMSDQGWRGLEAARVRLRYLHVEEVSEAMLSYLASYNEGEGLQELVFDDDSESGLSGFFYQNVLPKHQATLRKLETSGGLGSGWVVERSNADVYSGCSRLESLSVDFNAGEIDPSSPSDDIVATLLRFALFHPSINELTLHGVAPALPTGVCGTARMNRFHRIAQATKKAVLAARFPVNVTRKLLVRAGGSHFEIKSGSDRFTEKGESIHQS